MDQMSEGPDTLECILFSDINPVSPIEETETAKVTMNRWPLIDPPETVLESRIGLIDCKNSSQRQVYLLCKQARNVIDNLDDKLINWIDF